MLPSAAGPTMSTISNIVAFSVGTRLVNSENAPEESDDDDKADGADGVTDSLPDVEVNEETQLLDFHFPRGYPSLSSIRRRSSFFLACPRAEPEAKPDNRRHGLCPESARHISRPGSNGSSSSPSTSSTPLSSARYLV
jgi:hypothetical protein